VIFYTEAEHIYYLYYKNILPPSIKSAILDLEKIPQRMQAYKIELITLLIKWSDLILHD
jgi:hypothetical protein